MSNHTLSITYSITYDKDYETLKKYIGKQCVVIETGEILIIKNTYYTYNKSTRELSDEPCFFASNQSIYHKSQLILGDCEVRDYKLKKLLE